MPTYLEVSLTFLKVSNIWMNEICACQKARRLIALLFPCSCCCNIMQSIGLKCGKYNINLYFLLPIDMLHGIIVRLLVSIFIDSYIWNHFPSYCYVTLSSTHWARKLNAKCNFYTALHILSIYSDNGYPRINECKRECNYLFKLLLMVYITVNGFCEWLGIIIG